jgi:very-short-patch-repair endonuclease
VERTRQTVITGQKVKPEKMAAAKELRHNQTAEEKLLWRHLRANRLCGLHFRRQQVIDGFIADFYCHAAGVVVEVDGGIHQRQKNYDAERDQVLMSRQLKVLRFSNRDVREHLEDVKAQILDACRTESSSRAEEELENS